MALSRSIVLLVVLLCALPVCAVAANSGYAPHQGPQDFRGFVWGSTLEQCIGLSPVPDTRMKDTYYRVDEPLTMGDGDLLSVAYYFRKGGLYSVGISFRGEKNDFFLKDYLIKQFGPGRQIGARYGWMWEDFSVVLSFPPMGGEDSIGTIIYRYEGNISE